MTSPIGRVFGRNGSPSTRSAIYVYFSGTVTVGIRFERLFHPFAEGIGCRDRTPLPPVDLHREPQRPATRFTRSFPSRSKTDEFGLCSLRFPSSIMSSYATPIRTRDARKTEGESSFVGIVPHEERVFLNLWIGDHPHCLHLGRYVGSS